MRDLPLQQALDEYKTTFMPARNFSERSRLEYSNDLESLIDYLQSIGVTTVREMAHPHLERYLAELDRKGFSGSTRKRKVVSIRSFFLFLYQSGYTRINVARSLIPPLVEVNSPRFLTKEEYLRLRDASQGNPRDQAIIELFLQTGIRLSELVNLTIRDVELPANISSNSEETGYIRIMGSERRKGRTVQLNSRACAALKSYLAYRSIENNPALFLNRFGKALSSRGVEKTLSKYFLQSGIVNASPRSIRHTFGMQHAILGTSTESLKEAMGYQDARSTDIYISKANRLINREI